MANIEALNELVRVVQNTPDRDFNMEQWACGSVGCALGRAAMDSYFVERGLGFQMEISFQVPIFHSDGMPFMGSNAGWKFFDISYEQSWELFSPSRYRSDGWAEASLTPLSREIVLARIQHVIDHYTLQRNSHIRDYRVSNAVSAIIQQASVAAKFEETV